MSSNKNALIRYKTIDNCLRNRTKLWTLEDIIDACSDALYEYEGKYDLVSKRTVQLDIQNMRSEKLGYNAPIEVFQKKFYRYSEPDFSIKNIPVNENDIKVMNDAVQILKQFKDFSIFKEMNGVIQKLEDSVYASKQKAVIHLDKNERLKGLEFIDTLYDAILNKNVLKIEYKSFKARETNYYIIHPQLLKEYNNRWFLITWDEMTYLTLALDRVISIEKINAEYIDKNIDGDHFFKEVIGVTVSQRNRPMNVIFWIDKNNAPYVKTKPFHHSQEIIEELEDGTVFKISVQINFELERVILGFGESIKIIQPTKLKKKIIHKLRIAYKNYEE